MQSLHILYVYAGHQAFLELPGPYQFKGSCAPHFHVLMRDGREAWISISDLEVLNGKIPRRELVEVLRWAGMNQAMLLIKFEELQ